jgi:MFS family permease
MVQSGSDLESYRDRIVASEGRIMVATPTRTLLLASIGGALEFYDFVIFVFFTSVIARIFFPPYIPEWVRQVEAFGIFAAGYFARPLGGIVLAHFGDTRGRKRVFTASVLLMALPTLAIGLLPTYASVGIAAPLLLLSMRVVQGAALGGEIPGAWVFVAEHAGNRKPGLAIGLLTSGLATGLLLGSLTAIGLDMTFGSELIARGAWRIPFLLGGILGLVAVVLRRWLGETAVFQKMREKGSLSRELPLRVVIRDHPKAVLASILCTCMLTSGVGVVLLMTPTLLQKSFGLAARETQLANLVATVVVGCSTVLISAVTDRFGIRRVAVPALLLMVGSTYALYLGAEQRPALLLPLYAVAGLGAGATVLAPLIMVKAFPAAVRFSGVSVSYNIAYAVFGGLAPLLVSWLSHLDPISPAHYVAFTTALGALSLLLVPSD